MHDWRLHKLSIGTTSPGQSVRTQEMLGMCQRTPPAFLGRNSTTNDPRRGRTARCRLHFGSMGQAYPTKKRGCCCEQFRRQPEVVLRRVVRSNPCHRSMPAKGSCTCNWRGNRVCRRNATGVGWPRPSVRLQGIRKALLRCCLQSWNPKGSIKGASSGRLVRVEHHLHRPPVPNLRIGWIHRSQWPQSALSGACSARLH